MIISIIIIINIIFISIVIVIIIIIIIIVIFLTWSCRRCSFAAYPLCRPEDCRHHQRGDGSPLPALRSLSMLHEELPYYTDHIF